MPELHAPSNVRRESEFPREQRIVRLFPFIPRVLLGAFLVALFATWTSAAALAQISFVQVNSAVPQNTATVSATYTAAQTAGHMNIAAIAWDSSTIKVNSLKDSAGNNYKLAVSVIDPAGNTQSIYYASGIAASAASANTVTVTLSASTGYPDLRILEYTGVDTLDQTASAVGTATTANSGSVTTTHPNELLFGADYTWGTTLGAGSGYTSRVITGISDIAEDRTVSTTGLYSATASVDGQEWVMQLATFYASGGGGSLPPAPTGLTATAVSSSQINLSWTASTSATSYNVLRSTTNGGPYTQIASGVTTTSYSNSGLSAGTTYYYVVQAMNSVGTSGNSSQASAITIPVAPTGLTATAASSSQINLTWTASIGAASYNLLRSTTNGGPYSSVASGLITTSRSDTGLSASTTYYYVVQAVDAGGTSANSSQASAMTQAPAISVTISPTTASLNGGGTQQFTATVTGTSNTAVTWSVSGSGTVSSSGLYTAPSTISSQSTAMVTATSQADTTKSASATITLNPVVVSISPTSASVPVSQTQQFAARVTGSTNTNVTWEVNGLAGGNSTTGTVTSSGLYSAPVSVPNPATVNVSAVSQADSTKSATANVTINSNAGANFYVSPTGSDSNNGTSTTSAWQTIQHAMNSVAAGSTVNVMAGTYKESVTINVSGSATAGQVTLQNYSGQAVIIDGTGLSVSGQNGLLNINGQSYVTVQGLEIRNYSTSSTANVPVGIYITGGGSNISILNNHIHNIKTSASGCNANALGLAVYGNNGSVAISNLTISGNELDHMTTGCSETLTLNGNVNGFSVTNNKIHDNNNIGIDAIGFEGTSPSSATDQARNGVISGNTVYNITSYGNPAYGNQYAADGIYCDGCTNVIIDSNLIYNTDLNIEVASEHSGKTSSYVTVRNNLVYEGNSCGISIGGYSSGVGGSDHVVILNNTLWDNDTKNTGSGEFQIQYHAINNVFKNNIVYGSSQGLLLNNYTNSVTNPVDSDYNVFYSSVGSSSAIWVWDGTTETGFSTYQSSTGKDSHSVFSDPNFVNLSSTPPNLDLSSGSPAVNAGISSLTCSVGYCGSGTTIYGSTDYAGSPRINGNGQINIGAYEQ